jgi:ABC-type multidrug transport system fused ATPase/permease subunit
VHHEKFTRNLAATWSLKAIDRWLSVRLESLGNQFVKLSGLCVVYAAPSAGVSGLSLTNALYITSLLNWAVRTVADTESVMTSMERVVSVIRNTPKEEVAPRLTARPGVAAPKHPARQLVAPGPYASDAELVNSGWPWRGSLTFEGVRMRYRDDLPYVLDNVTFEVHHGERIGIVGRTGSGKSSIFNALLGFAEMEDGTTKIDGIDVRSIHRSTLRNAVSIIPQEPVLFSGTVRQNLDPLHQFTDERLWQALEKAKLEPTIRAMKGGLDARVNSGGMSLSTGQRQLMCLARALLRRTRILLLDEVTAAIDPDTEMLVQKTIREEFAGCTILAVAHRLHTILDSDKVIVLDAGKVVEFAPPLSLLRSRDSAFSQLLRQQQHQ